MGTQGSTGEGPAVDNKDCKSQDTKLQGKARSNGITHSGRDMEEGRNDEVIKIYKSMNGSDSVNTEKLFKF